MTSKTTWERACRNYARRNLSFAADWLWAKAHDHLPSSSMHREWYETLQPDDRPNRLHIQAAREHAKTTCLAVKYPIWRVGNNHNLRVMIVSKSATLTTTILREIKQNIEGNRRVVDTFHLKPATPWSDSELQVTRSPGVIMKDPTFVGVGLHGPLTGKRADLIIVDDPFDESEVRTKAQRRKVVDWVEKLLIPTLTPEGEMVLIGTPWHYDDLWAHLEGKSIEKGGLYIIKKYPAVLNPEDSPDKWRVQWSQRWPPHKLAERKKEIGSVKFSCLYLLDPSGLEGATFKRDWLTYFDPSIFTMGYIKDFSYYMGVDPNVSGSPDSDRLAIVTIAHDRRRGHIYVLDIYAEPMDFPAQMKKIIELSRRRILPFIPDRHSIRKVGIEANAWQQAVSKAASAELIPVIEVKQTQSKVDRMLSLQPHFENGSIKLPDPRFGVNWWDKFETEYLSYPLGRYKDIMDALQIAFEMAAVSKKASSIGSWVR